MSIYHGILFFIFISVCYTLTTEKKNVITLNSNNYKKHKIQQQEKAVVVVATTTSSLTHHHEEKIMSLQHLKAYNPIHLPLLSCDGMEEVVTAIDRDSGDRTSGITVILSNPMPKYYKSEAVSQCMTQ